jgi:hypothetical protein
MRMRGYSLRDLQNSRNRCPPGELVSFIQERIGHDYRLQRAAPESYGIGQSSLARTRSAPEVRWRLRQRIHADVSLGNCKNSPNAFI